jgi:hypothetical protein
MMMAVQASPPAKVATLSKESLALVASVRSQIEAQRPTSQQELQVPGKRCALPVRRLVCPFLC